jgi:pentatricopeptide repeat protein
MFTCRACTKRALTVLLEHAFPLDASRSALRNSLPSDARPRSRTYTTAAVAVKGRHAIESSDPAENDEHNSKRSVSKSAEWAVKKQLQYLDDPLFIAQQVERTLAKERFEEAAFLVRNASKVHKVAVSWNHLIDYQLRNHRLNAALKLFNEMKKRAQPPNAQTYTIIFRGCAASPHPQMAVREAVRLYNNMLASERLTPNTIHMNAVLQVCARAEDIDTMFTIIQTANDGVRAPNNRTYTTIINALRAKVDKPQTMRDMTETQISEDKEQAIQRGQAIWEEVLTKWRSAQIVVDEELVCSMGRMLLMGDYHQMNSIFSLVEQTMKIPSDPAELSRLVSGDTTASPTDVKETGKESGNKSVAKVGKMTSNGRHPMHARPGNNSLSLILSAVEGTGKVALARRYWTIFTLRYGVAPDAENWYALFRALRRGKSSTKTVEYLSEMPKHLMSPKLFRTTMYTCLRDNINKSAFNNATQILEIMLTSLRIPDMQTLRTYLRVAYANKRLFEELSKKDINGAKLAWGNQLNTALENLWEPYLIAAKQFAYGGLAEVPEKKHVEKSDQEEWMRDAAPRAELAALARKMIAAHDRLIFGNFVPDSLVRRIKPRRNALNTFVVKYFENREALEPGWSRKVELLEKQEEEEGEDFLNVKADEAW